MFHGAREQKSGSRDACRLVITHLVLRCISSTASQLVYEGLDRTVNQKRYVVLAEWSSSVVKGNK